MHEKRNNTKNKLTTLFGKSTKTAEYYWNLATPCLCCFVPFFACLSMGPTTNPGWPTDFAFLHNLIALQYIFFATTARITGFLGEKQSVLS